MPVSSLLIDGMTSGQDFDILSGMTLVWGDVVDPAMLVLMVVPLDKASHPVTRRLQRSKSGLGEVRHVFASSEQRLHEGIVIAHPRTAERGRDAQLAEHDLYGLALDRATIVTVEDQWLVDAAFPPDRLLHQLTGQHGTLAVVYLPAYDLAA